MITGAFSAGKFCAPKNYTVVFQIPRKAFEVRLLTLILSGKRFARKDIESVRVKGGVYELMRGTADHIEFLNRYVTGERSKRRNLVIWRAGHEGGLDCEKYISVEVVVGDRVEGAEIELSVFGFERGFYAEKIT